MLELGEKLVVVIFGAGTGVSCVVIVRAVAMGILAATGVCGIPGGIGVVGTVVVIVEVGAGRGM